MEVHNQLANGRDARIEKRELGIQRLGRAPVGLVRRELEGVKLRNPSIDAWR